VLLLCAAALPAAAHASSATVSGTVLTITAKPGEANDFTISASGTDQRGSLIQIRDAGSTDTLPNSSTKRVVGGGECDQDSTGRAARCPIDNLTSVVVDLGDLDDKYNGAGLRVDTQLTLGPGNDVGSTEREASDTLTGGDGDDTLEAVGNGSSSDALDAYDGGAGSDTLIVGRSSGTDNVSGGPGTDTVSYATRSFNTAGTAGVTVILDGLANDGGSSDDDNIGTDVENVIGSSRADIITGSAVNNTLDGGAGGDSIRGASGADLLIAGAGTDQLDGGDGSDTLRARDGIRETVLCGNSVDTAELDLEDNQRLCEIIDTSPADDGLPSHAAGKRFRFGGVRIVCPKAALVRCRGRVDVGLPKGPSLVSGRYDIPVGATRKIALDFDAATRRALRRRGQAKVTTLEQGRSEKGPRSSQRLLAVK
jgi:Ca2+-binding RTX toxin-like protein